MLKGSKRVLSQFSRESEKLKTWQPEKNFLVWEKANHHPKAKSSSLHRERTLSATRANPESHSSLLLFQIHVRIKGRK